MKERGKKTVMEQRNDDVSEFSCRKHPSVSVVGICQYCLNDRLVNLVCSECGEQRLSSCSCSDISSNRISNATVDAPRISSLIDEETTAKKDRKTEKVLIFKRSSSSCVEIKRKKDHKLSKFGRFFKKINLKKEKDLGDDKKIDSWVLDYKKSRSLCSFRGNGYFIGSEEDGSSYSGARSSLSAARSSSVNGGLGIYETVENRKSNFEGRKSNFSETTTENRKSNFSESEPPRRSCFEPPRRSNFSETMTENRKSNFSESEPPRRSGFEQPRRSNFGETEYNRNNQTAAENSNSRRSNFSESTAEQHRKSDTAVMNFTRRVFSMKESYFTGGEEPGFIDLKFDSLINDGVLEHGGGGGSCRLTTKDREMQKSRKSFKGWKWIFRHHRDS